MYPYITFSKHFDLWTPSFFIKKKTIIFPHIEKQELGKAEHYLHTLESTWYEKVGEVTVLREQLKRTREQNNTLEKQNSNNKQSFTTFLLQRDEVRKEADELLALNEQLSKRVNTLEERVESTEESVRYVQLFYIHDYVCS